MMGVNAVLVYLDAAGPSSVKNHGSILSEGGVGVRFVWSAGDTGGLVLNTGLISGGTIAIDMGDGDDKVINSGQITGHVMLRGGNDAFDGIAGRVEDSNLGAGATVFGGNGQDVFRVSDQGIVIDGEAGIDRIESTVSWSLSRVQCREPDASGRREPARHRNFVHQLPDRQHRRQRAAGSG